MAESISLFALADTLAEELLDCGHDGIAPLDILDALASTGLTLTVGEGAREAYVEALGVKVVS